MQAACCVWAAFIARAGCWHVRAAAAGYAIISVWPGSSLAIIGILHFLYTCFARDKQSLLDSVDCAVNLFLASVEATTVEEFVCY